MQPQLCSRCKKNVAVVFITRMENGKNINEGLCLKCAKNLGLPQVNEMMQRMGITDEDLDNISNEMMSAFGGAENLEGIDAPDGDDEELVDPLELAAEYKNGEMILGAGTVLDAETARIAILSGAQYIVSPYYDEATVRLCNRYAIPCMPGVMTIKDVVAALEMGVDIIKLFPGDAFGPGMVKAIKGPIPQANIMPTGGVDVNNVAQWIKAGVVAVGAGSSLTKGAKTGDYKAITETGKQFVENIKNARASLAR